MKGAHIELFLVTLACVVLTEDIGHESVDFRIKVLLTLDFSSHFIEYLQGVMVLSLVKSFFSLRNSEIVSGISSLLHAVRSLAKEIKSFIEVLDLIAAKNANLRVFEWVHSGIEVLYHLIVQIKDASVIFSLHETIVFAVRK